MQICRGYLVGQTSKKAGAWNEHLLAGSIPEGLHFFARFEYQDGSRKAGTQQYHGSGRPHVYILFWIKNLADANLAAEDSNLEAYIKDSQLDWHGNSRWPVWEEPSVFNDASRKLYLYHSADDSLAGVRAYFPCVMGALKRHQDVQMADGRGLILNYVSKYIAKFSDSSYKE